MKTIQIKTFAIVACHWLTCLFAHSPAAAQVTIGSTDNPKAGAILDLNSTVKGGLLLSNVALDDLGAIPTSFPSMAGAEAEPVKNGLKGALVYNTNPNTCPSIHVWNGDYWERITANSIKATGTPLSSSNAGNLFGGDVVEFTATYPGAKTYRWYASANDDAYEYLAVTTTPNYSQSFPSGRYKVKVIMDDCRSLIESNEVSFTPASLSPNFGSLSGGNYLYIYGDFPHAASIDYVQNGLVAHYDGINNQGLGDKRHSFISTTAWKDLKSGFEFPRGTGAGQWLSNGFQALDDGYSFYDTGFPTTFPAGGAARTVEVIFRTPDVMFEQANEVRYRIFGYGEETAAHTFGVEYRGLTSTDWSIQNGCPAENPWLFYAILGNNNNLMTCLSSTPSLETPNTINTVTSTYANSIQDALTNSYINNTPAQIVGRAGNSLNTLQGPLFVGRNLAKSTFLSVRLYNRVLNAEEIAHNADLDQKRYLTPPTVTIDDQNCTEVVVLSPHFLMCKVPEGTSTGSREVKVNGVSYGQAYEYVDPQSAFYISSILPIVGSAGQTLTLTGNRLNEISEVRVGGALCTNLSANPTSATCTLPSNPSGEADITIIANGETYRFAKVFEYE